MTKSLFANAVKAIRQGQPELLEMFLKKHPGIATVKGSVERDGGTRVRAVVLLVITPMVLRRRDTTGVDELGNSAYSKIIRSL